MERLFLVMCSRPLLLDIGAAKCIVVVTWLLTDRDTDTAKLGITKFEKWYWKDRSAAFRSYRCFRGAKATEMWMAGVRAALAKIEADKKWAKHKQEPAEIDKTKTVKEPLQESETKITEADKLPEKPAILINCDWENPLTPEQVRQTEEDCGPLASTLAELAQIVREADRSTEAGLFLKDTYKLIQKARVSAIQLRPKIELVIGEDQAADFYKELVSTLWFYESDERPYACWLGRDGKAEGIARKLERWHKNILLLTKPETAVSQRDKKPLKGPLLESIHKAYENFAKLAEPEVRMDGLTFQETAYAEAVVIDYLTEQFGEQDDALGNWPSDWHECPEAFELYKAKIREFRAGQAKASLDEVRRIAELQPEQENEPAETVQKIEPGKEAKAENVFKKKRDVWEVRFQGQTEYIPNNAGFPYIKLLLNQQGKTFTTTEFLSLYNDKSVTLANGDNQLDDEAKEDYERSLADIEYRLQEAKNNNDFGTQKKLEEDKASLMAELEGATGFGGRSKKLNPEFDKFRLSTGNAIVRAIKKIEEYIPALAEHLRDAIRSPHSGTSLSYHPSKLVTWSL